MLSHPPLTSTALNNKFSLPTGQTDISDKVSHIHALMHTHMTLERKLREAKIVVINNNNDVATDKEQQQRINLTTKLNFRLYTISG